MAILVTGGAGYIGSVTTTKLIKKNETVVVVDDLSEGRRDAVSNKAVFYKGNFGDTTLLRKIFFEHEIDCVMHFAASANVPDSVINPQKYYINNVLNTISMLQVMLEFNVKKIIFSSTAAVYGEPEYTPIDEKHPTVPINPYGFSKLFVEQILLDYATSYDLKYIIFRYFCAAGAIEENGESREKETHLIPLVIDAAIDTSKTISVFGNNYPTIDGTGVRDYIHVEDIANAHILGFEKIEKVNNIILNLGTNSGYSVTEIIENACKILNKKINYYIVNKRPGDPATLVASNKLALELLQWKPENNIIDIIESAYKWRKTPKY